MERSTNAYYELVAATVTAFNERIQCDEIEQGDDYSDALHEVVDGLVPHYYHEIFTVMAADGIDHEFSDSGLMPDSKDVTVILQARIYEALYNDVPDDCNVVWFEEEEEENDAGEASEVFFVISKGINVSWYDTLEKAIESANERYNTMGIECHVEGETDDVLYNPKGDIE